MINSKNKQILLNSFIFLFIITFTDCVDYLLRQLLKTQCLGNRRKRQNTQKSQDQQHRRNSSIAGTAASAALLIAKLL
jgi:hypothetical protein